MSATTSGLFRTGRRFSNYVGVPRGTRLLDKHPAVALGSIGGRTMTFSVVNDPDTVESIQNWLDENDIPAYRADKSPEWVTEKVDELFSDEITDEDDGEMITYRGQDYTDKSRYTDRQSIERDVQGPASIDDRGRDDRCYLIAFTTELKAD